jgi:YfiH family protein
MRSTEPRPPFGPEATPLLAPRGLGAQPAFAKQVHGAAVLRAERGGFAGHGDALATAHRGLPLVISTADCLPIVLYDARAGRLAAVHAGWRGTVQSVAGAAVAELVAAGSAAADLVVAIGPSIGPCCYEVDAPVIARFEAAFPGAWEPWMTPKGPGKWMLDLWRANRAQLIGAGVRPERVDLLRLCTGCRPDLLFSYRRERGAGRLVTVAALPERAC